MKVIYKQELRLGCGEQTIRIVGLWTVLKVELQAGVPCVWFLCDIEGPETDVVFTTLGTGETRSDEWFKENLYLDTYQITDPGMTQVFVGHVFMRSE